ncbi:MAG TPA: tryptophan 7-halogenase, partial [Bacillota bacterium]|nr:tryptophan 7-halogenase [Bacillota bacterium]
IERDHLPDGLTARTGTPQAEHTHALLDRGKQILEGLFPGFFADMATYGVLPLDTAGDARWFHRGSWKMRFPSGYAGYPMSRRLLEWKVRRRVGAIAGVRIVDDSGAAGLITEDGRVAGVRLHNGQALPADLVIDASGRGSLLPEWLETIGFPPPELTKIRVDLGYATRLYRRPEGPRDWAIALCSGGARAGYVVPIEGGLWSVTLVGYFGDHPPVEDPDFLDFARSLPIPDIHAALQAAEPLGPAVRYRFMAYRWHRYERLHRFPAGLVAMGDSVCSFNPAFGQGMTTAAVEATVLQQWLLSGGTTSTFQRRVAAVVRDVWLMATAEDFRFPETDGRRPPAWPAMQWLMDRFIACSNEDELAMTRFLEVMHMHRRPLAALADPALLAAMLDPTR